MQAHSARVRFRARSIIFKVCSVDDLDRVNDQLSPNETDGKYVMMSKVKISGYKFFRRMHVRVIQNFKHDKFISATAFLYSLRKRNAEKCQNYQNRTTFKGAY